jgi:ankyrin repeat protein
MLSKNNLFNNFPTDVQREVCMLLDHKDIKKLTHKFYDNPEDVYWKMKTLQITDEVKPEGVTYRDFYESFVYEKFISKKLWNNGLLYKMIEDEVFLLRHANARDVHGMTALSYAAGFEVRCCKILLDAGANVNLPDYTGVTPLMSAASFSKIEIVKLLLSYKADVNMKTKYGTTTLSYAKLPYIRSLLQNNKF